MQIDTIENNLFAVTLNPLLRELISRFDLECPEDGSLLLNSLKDFLGEHVSLCPTCRSISRNIARPFYEIGSRLLKTDKDFMRTQFINGEYGEAWFKGFGLMMKGVEKYGIRIPFVPAGPFEVVWNVTYKCNLKCKHCYEDAGNKKLPELTTDEAKQVVDILSKIAGVGLPALSFSGGEPLARRDFFELAAYAKKRIPYISIASNGTLITKDVAKKIKDVGVDYVEISIDGASSKVHDEFRGIPGAFEKALQGVKNCAEEGIDTCIATVLHRNNFAETEKIIKLAKELDVRFMHFNYIPTGRAKAHIELDLTPEERLNILQTIGKEIINLYLQAKEEELKKGRSDIKVDRFFSTCPQYACVTKELSRQVGQKFMVEAHYAAKKGVENVANFLGGCGAGRLYCALEPNGDIKPCVFFPTNETTVLGNILKDNYEEIWDKNPLLWQLRIRETLETYIMDGEELGCGSCPDKYICGGCRARAYSYFKGNVKAPDIGCIRNKPLWEKIMKKHL
ncbi:MAG: radical SAM protein [Candidatus Bathyarchaeota archaeon]|nr:radical SAM protein [Candidatus Bathyarchaeota archaeon]MDW8040033.1 radical SAM protein [Nitrososphaerota archaeon]